MTEELKIIASIVDFPVTVMGFVWALRMIERMNKQTVKMLEECLADRHQE